MTTMRVPFPEVLDSTILAAARSCGQKVFREFFEHWKGKDPSVHLHAGASYAKGMEVARKAYFEGVVQTPFWSDTVNEATGEVKKVLHWKEETPGNVSAEDAVALGVGALLANYGDFQHPEDSAKSANRTAGALEYYFSQYPLGEDKAEPIILATGKRAIEFSFAEPIDELHPTTGMPLIYCGRMDMICSFEGMTLGEDDKTASQLGASWPRQWDLRSQFTGYTWGAKKAGNINLQGFLIRGVSILKTKYDTLQAITYRPEWQIDRWYNQMLRDVHRLKQQWEEGYFDFNLDHACTEYGGCQFKQVCLTRDPNAVLEQFFERRKWDPITRTETKL